MKLARDLCNEILRLNENDNTGARYLLMAIYAYFEEENDMLAVYKKYKEENLEMLFPLFVLYYKLSNEKKANEYLKRIDEANPYFIKYFKGTLKPNDKVPRGYYQLGDVSEIITCFGQNEFLMDTVPMIDYYILENLKSSKSSKKSVSNEAR